MADTPISGLKPTTLDEYFSQNPETLTEAGETAIIAELRHRRTIWKQSEATGVTRAPKTKGTQVVDLKDLGL